MAGCGMKRVLSRRSVRVQKVTYACLPCTLIRLEHRKSHEDDGLAEEKVVEKSIQYNVPLPTPKLYFQRTLSRKESLRGEFNTASSLLRRKKTKRTL
jgi:hypothetical protein